MKFTGPLVAKARKQAHYAINPVRKRTEGPKKQGLSPGEGRPGLQFS